MACSCIVLCWESTQPDGGVLDWPSDSRFNQRPRVQGDVCQQFFSFCPLFKTSFLVFSQHQRGGDQRAGGEAERASSKLVLGGWGDWWSNVIQLSGKVDGNSLLQWACNQSGRGKWSAQEVKDWTQFSYLLIGSIYDTVGLPEWGMPCPESQPTTFLINVHFLHIFPFFVRVLTWSFSKYSSITQSHHWVCDVDGLKPQQLPTGIVLVATAICPFIAALTSHALDQPPLCWLMYYYAECDADLFNQLPLFP